MAGFRVLLAEISFSHLTSARPVDTPETRKRKKGSQEMTQTQINAALAQAENIIAMMTAEEKAWFASLDANAQFHVMCASLAATAFA